MLSKKSADKAIKILILLIILVFSSFFLTKWVPESNFIKESYESVESSNDTVMTFSAAALSLSLAMTALPQDFSSSLADTLADMNIVLMGILAILLLEKILILYGVELAFTYLIPGACAAWILSIVINKHGLKAFAVKLISLALAVAFVVPCSTHLANYVAADYMNDVETAILEAEAGAKKLNDATVDDEEGTDMFEKLSALFQTAIKGVSDLMLYFQNTIRRCTSAVAMLILINFIMPLITFFILKWILKEAFGITVPAPPMSRKSLARNISKFKKEPDTELALVGENDDED